MRRWQLKLLAPLAVLGLAAPAAASWGSSRPQPKPPVTSTAVPEPADFILFGAGVVGLLLGRRGSRSRRDRD